jgi:hypothetical protein
LQGSLIEVGIGWVVEGWVIFDGAVEGWVISDGVIEGGVISDRVFEIHVK